MAERSKAVDSSDRLDQGYLGNDNAGFPAIIPLSQEAWVRIPLLSIFFPFWDHDDSQPAHSGTEYDWVVLIFIRFLLQSTLESVKLYKFEICPM